MATNWTIDLPSSICEGFPSARTALRDLLIEALDQGLQPAKEWPSDHPVRVSLYVATEVETRVRRIAAEVGQSQEEVVAGLAYACSAQRDGGSPADLAQRSKRGWQDPQEKLGLPPHTAPRKDVTAQPQDERTSLQTRLLLPLMSGLSDGKIVFAEGGTGLGKSRIIARCALEYLGANKAAKVLILAPTVSVLAHLVREFRQVAPAGFSAVSVVLGRGQFVSCKRLESLLAAPPPDPTLEPAWEAASRWFADGGKPSAGSEHRLAHEFSLCWLADELRRVAPMFPVDDIVLGAADEEAADPAQAVYQELRQRAFEQEIKIVFATQAMACLNVWSYLRPERQKGILPSCSLLLIDEAHELEEAMARAIGSNISFLHLRQVLRQGVEQARWQELHLAKVANEALSCLDQAERLLRQIPNAGLISSWEAAENDSRLQTFTKFLSIARSLDAALEPFTTLQDNEDASGLPLRLFREWHLALQQMLGGRQNVWLDFSPVVRSPRLTVGPSQLVRPFAELWASCAAAGLLSGTLYLPNADGRLSSGFLRMKLLVPRERAHEINPVHPAWNHTIPTVHLPNAAAARRLLYPGSADDAQGATEVEKWHCSIAEHLQKISHTAAGGTLVLCCSYLDVRALGELLEGHLPGRLLASRGSGSLRILGEEFVRHGREGARPVWLATGSAWTGLDLGDRADSDPAKDFVLSDLVITRIPFGFNKTAVHLARTKRLGFDVECMEAALRLKQGLGRLIRRAGVSQRRIWVLDGRSHFGSSAYFKRVFGPVFIYPNRKFFG